MADNDTVDYKKSRPIDLYIEDFVANALIYLADYNIREVRYKALDKYIEEIVSYIKEKYHIEAICYLWKEFQAEFWEHYCEDEKWFDLDINSKGQKVVVLRDGITKDMLIDRFRSYLSYELFDAFTNEQINRRTLLPKVPDINDDVDSEEYEEMLQGFLEEEDEIY